MPQESDDSHDWKLPPAGWGEEQARTVALEVRRLRGKRSAKWLADRTRELGFEVSRSVISDLEIGRRRYVTTTELIILARALDTAPIALLYPGPYLEGKIKVLPAPSSGKAAPEVTQIDAVHWFTGDNAEYSLYLVGLSSVDQMNYYSNLLALERAHKVIELQNLKDKFMAQMNLKINEREAGLHVDDKEIDYLMAASNDLENRIEKLIKLGRRDLGAEAYDEMFGDGG